MIENLGQGHRVNHTREVRDDLLILIQRVWKTFPRKVNGKPRHAEPTTPPKNQNAYEAATAGRDLLTPTTRAQRKPISSRRTQK
jgi:hypothetical protein